MVNYVKGSLKLLLKSLAVSIFLVIICEGEYNAVNVENELEILKI